MTLQCLYKSCSSRFQQFKDTKTMLRPFTYVEIWPFQCNRVKMQRSKRAQVPDLEIQTFDRPQFLHIRIQRCQKRGYCENWTKQRTFRRLCCPLQAKGRSLQKVALKKIQSRYDWTTGNQFATNQDYEVFDESFFYVHFETGDPPPNMNGSLPDYYWEMFVDVDYKSTVAIKTL